jgi:hypothetical protein
MQGPEPSDASGKTPFGDKPPEVPVTDGASTYLGARINMSPCCRRKVRGNRGHARIRGLVTCQSDKLCVVGGGFFLTTGSCDDQRVIPGEVGVGVGSNHLNPELVHMEWLLLLMVA